MAGRVYDAIESCNYKSALKLCERGGKSDLILALKALTLQRLGRNDEATSLCHDLCGRTPTDENILLPLTSTLNMLSLDEEASRCWELASDKCPEDESLAREHFFSRVRRCDFAKQRGVAMKIYKAHPNAVYLSWCATSACLEAQYATASSDMVLRLADKMAARAIFNDQGDAKAASADELELLVTIRRRRGDLEGSLDAVRKSKTVPADRALQMTQPLTLRRTEAELVAALGRHGEAASLWTGLVLESGGAQFSDVRALADAAIIEGGDVLEKAKIDLLSCSGRGGALGMLEVHSRLGNIDELREGVLSYAEVYANKMSCFDDLEVFLGPLTKDAALLEALQRKISHYTKDEFTVETLNLDDDDGVVASAAPSSELDDLARRHSYAKLSRYLGGDVGDVDQIIKAARRAHALGDVPLCNEMVLMGYGLSNLEDGWCLLEWARHGFSGEEAVGCHEQLALAVTEASAKLGAQEAALGAYGRLGIKHIQLDSLGWLLYPWCGRGGFFVELRAHCRNVLGMHRSARRDAGQYSARAYATAHVCRALEVVEFQKKKMDCSLQLACSRAELSSLELTLEYHTLDDSRKFLRTTAAEKSELAKPTLATVDHIITGSSSFSANHDWKARGAWLDPLDVTAPASLRNRRLELYLYVTVAMRDLLRSFSSEEATLSPAACEEAVGRLEAIFSQCGEDADVDLRRVGCETPPWLAHRTAPVTWEATTRGYRALLSEDHVQACGALTEALETARQEVIARAASTECWLSGVSLWVQHALTPLSLVVQLLIEKAKPQKKKKKKAGENSPFAVAVLGCLEALERCATELRAALLLLLGEEKPTESKVSFYPPEIRTALRETIASSQKLSFERLLTVVNAKLTVLSALKATHPPTPPPSAS